MHEPLWIGVYQSAGDPGNSKARLEPTTAFGVQEPMGTIGQLWKKLIPLLLLTASLAFGQFGDDLPAFEVASVKAAPIARVVTEGSRHQQIDAGPASLTMRNVTLSHCIQWAYNVKFYQISGPAWLKDERYDIAAKPPGPVARDRLRLMLQTLLARRFSLVLHRDTKLSPVYELVAGKGGPKLQPARAEGTSGMRVLNGSFVFQLTSMAELAERLSDLAGIDRPVLDRTAIQGVFDFTLRDAARRILDGDGSAIFETVEDQLGLRLEPQRDPIDILVIDHAEKTPGEN